MTIITYRDGVMANGADAETAARLCVGRIAYIVGDIQTERL